VIFLDGSQGEGGGQIVRTALTLSCVLGVPVQIENIRAGRKPSGLRPQHLTAIRAAAEICDAAVDGLQVGARTVRFEPGGPAKPGQYEWAVGTAGSAPLVIQTVLLPLALADGPSTIRVAGGTHVPGSPSGHYLRDVVMPVLLSMGADLEIYMEAYGWMPEGGGSMSVHLAGRARLAGLDMCDRGPIERVFGLAVGCNLPSHIPQRIANRALNLLETMDAPLDIRPIRTRSISTGAGIFLAVEYTNGRFGVGVLGRKGMPSETVAEQAVTELLELHDSGAATDEHLADQLVVPLALAQGPSAYTTRTITPHLMTNVAVVQAFLDRPIALETRQRLVTIGE